MILLRVLTALGLLGVTSAFAEAATSAPAQAAHKNSPWTVYLLPILLIVVFYFLLIRPQSKRAKDQRRMLEKIGVGEEVMTAGGIVGRVVRLKDNYVVLKVSKEVEITVQKSSVATVLPKGTVDSLN